jgi:ATP-dependent RNA circularization protein (DNA/RNA ligase family)
MRTFFRFPHTPHLAWLGGGEPRDDKVLSPAEAQALLAGDVVIEEKLDGANLGFSLDASGALQAQNRGQYLSDPPTGQFARLAAWLAQHGDVLIAALEPTLILFGEWCAARHSLDYVALPDWFLLFDVYDRAAGRFWSTARRDELAGLVNLSTVPRLALGHYKLPKLQQFMKDTPSRYRAGRPLEGIVVRRDVGDWCEARAKLVRPEFVQAIDEHWRRRAIEWNRVSFGAHPGDGAA